MDPKDTGQNNETEEENGNENAVACILNSNANDNISLESGQNEVCLDADSKESISKQSQENQGTVENLMESVEQCNKQIDTLSLNVKEEILVKVEANTGVLYLEPKEDIPKETQVHHDINGTLLESIIEREGEDNTNLDRTGLNRNETVQDVDLKKPILKESQINEVIGSCEIVLEENLTQSILKKSQPNEFLASYEDLMKSSIHQSILQESQVTGVKWSCEGVLDADSKQSISKESQANEVGVDGYSGQSISKQFQASEIVLDADLKQRMLKESQVHEEVTSYEGFLESGMDQKIAEEFQVKEIVGSYEGVLELGIEQSRSQESKQNEEIGISEVVLELGIEQNRSKESTVNEDIAISEGVLELERKQCISKESKENEIEVPYEGVLESDIKPNTSVEFQVNGDSGAFEAYESGVEHKDEEMLLQGDKEVTILAASVLIPGKTTPSPATFTFGTTGLTMKLQDDDLELIIVNWLLDDINRCKFCTFHGTCSVIIELELSESGVLALQETVGPLQYVFGQSCYTVSFVVSNAANALDDVIRQICSLSDGYKSILKIEAEQFSYSQEEIADGVYESHAAVLENWCDIVFPKDDVDPVTITKYDYLLLNPDEFLSDTIVDFYIKYLQLQCIPGEARDRFYFYNSFFFRKLTDVNDRKYASPFDRVKRWTSKVNIFDKDYLFIPIMQSAHWSLIIICNPGYLAPGDEDACPIKAPLILHLDSLEGSHEGLEEPIRNYVLEAWNQKTQKYPDFEKSSSMKFIAARVPQQNNFTDCGLFLLHYVEMFILGILQGHTIDFLSDGWFDPADASRKRFRLQEIIRSLQEDDSAAQQNGSKKDTTMATNGDEKFMDAPCNGGDVDSDDDDCIMEVRSSYDQHQDCQMQPGPGDILRFSNNVSENFHMLPNALPETAMSHVYGGSASHLLNNMIADEDMTAVHMMQGCFVPGGETSFPIPAIAVDKYSRFSYSMGNPHDLLGGIGFAHSCHANVISNDGQVQMMGSSQMLMDSGWEIDGERGTLIGQVSGTMNLSSGHGYSGDIMNSGINQYSISTAIDLTQTCDENDMGNISEVNPNAEFHPKGGNFDDMTATHKKIKKARRKSKAKLKRKHGVCTHLLRQASTWRPFTRSARRMLQSRLKSRCLHLLRRTNLLK